MALYKWDTRLAWVWIPFTPTNVGTQWQVLKKWDWDYEWETIADWIVYMSQSEYDSLSQEEKMNGTSYGIVGDLEPEVAPIWEWEKVQITSSTRQFIPDYPCIVMLNPTNDVYTSYGSSTWAKLAGSNYTWIVVFIDWTGAKWLQFYADETIYVARVNLPA